MPLTRRRFLGLGSALTALAVVSPSAVLEVLRSSASPEAAEALVTEHATWLRRRAIVLDPVGPGPFGLWGDGLHDDTIAMQMLIDAAAASHRHALLPSGEFRLTESLIVPAVRGLVIDGGHHSLLRHDARSTAAAGLVMDGRAQQQVIRNINLWGPRRGAAFLFTPMAKGLR